MQSTEYLRIIAGLLRGLLLEMLGEALGMKEGEAVLTGWRVSHPSHTPVAQLCAPVDWK